VDTLTREVAFKFAAVSMRALQGLIVRQPIGAAVRAPNREASVIFLSVSLA
jgi:hypothetical protein